MQRSLKLAIILLQVCLIPWTAVGSSEPYCYKNVTETSYRMVTKTRLKSVSSKNVFKKLIFKKDTQVEIYEEQEPMYKTRLERSCCEGYKLSHLDLCEPQCVQNGCPAHSKCVEPEVCECLSGYFSTRSASNGPHYCEPICEKPCPEHSACVAPNVCACKKGYHVGWNSLCKPFCGSGCPHGGVCIAPNKCSCQEGYVSEKGSCVPTCLLGDQCQNGKCMAKDVCFCDPGFRWNNETFSCELDGSQSTTYYPDFTETQQHVVSVMEEETDIETSNDEIDPNEVFDEAISTTTVYTTDEDGSTPSSHKHHKCPEDYVFHGGECRSRKFASNEVDCWLKPCQDKHAFCLENGTCACIEGFQMFQLHFNDTTTSECLSALDYETRQRNLDQASPEQFVKQPINWTAIVFLVLGICIILTATVGLGMKLFLKQTGEMDVEGKNMACVYNKRGGSEAEKSVF